MRLAALATLSFVLAALISTAFGGAAAPPAELARLRKENAQLRATVAELKHTRMLVPNPHNGEGSVVIAGRHYWLEYAKDAGYTHSPRYRPTGDPSLAYYFRKNVGCLRLNPQQTELPQEISGQWPLEALAADGCRAIVLSDGRLGYGDKLVPCIVDPRGWEVLASFKALAHCSRWLFAPGGKYAYPLKGSAAGGLPYVDVAGKEVRFIAVTNESDLYWHFSGVRLDSGKTLLLFANNTTHEADERVVRRRHVVRLNPDEPEKLSVTRDPIGVSSVYAAKNGGVLCELCDGRVALVSADGLKLLAGSAVSDKGRDRVKWLGFAPQGNDVYVLGEFSGLHIRDAATLRCLASVRVGRSWNAYSIGVTFSADGKHAYVATPYESYFAVIDTHKRELVAKVALKTSAAGVLLWPWKPKQGVSENRGSCLVITTRLPWE